MNDVIYSSTRFYYGVTSLAIFSLTRRGGKLVKCVSCCCFSKENRVAPDSVGSEDIPAAPRGQLVDLGLADIIEATRK